MKKNNRLTLLGITTLALLLLAFFVPAAEAQTCPGSCLDMRSNANRCAPGWVSITSDSCPSGSLCCIQSGGAAGLVPCGNGSNYADRCTLCHLVLGFQVLITYSFRILLFVALLMLVVAGVMYIFSAGSEEMIRMAKGIMKNTLYGFAFVLGAWLIINYTMIILGTKTDLGIAQMTDGWWNFTCVR